MTATQGGVLIGNRLISAMNANKSATFPGSDMTLEVINNGDANYRACVFTGHDISSIVTGIGIYLLVFRMIHSVYIPVGEK